MTNMSCRMWLTIKKSNPNQFNFHKTLFEKIVYGIAPLRPVPFTWDNLIENLQDKKDSAQPPKARWLILYYQFSGPKSHLC